MKKGLIIFDCFGVIFDDVAPKFLKKYLPESAALDLKDELFSPADLGEISYDTLMTNLSKKLNLQKDILLKEWNSMLILNDAIIPYIEKFKKDYDIALLSNAPEKLVETLFEKHGISHLFDKIFISYKYKMAKPDANFYLLCVNSFGKSYDKIYMTDDNPVNLKDLKSIGITPILFESIKSLDVID